LADFNDFWQANGCKRSSYDFFISQGSVATVLRWGGQF